jgi:hypothetical protein
MVNFKFFSLLTKYMTETATEKIARALLLHPKKRWKQVQLAAEAGCSKAFVSKLTKKFLADGIIVRPKTEILLLCPTKLLNEWIKIHTLPRPVYIQSKFSKEQILQKLKRSKDYALTGFSAAWYRIKYMKTNRIEMYVLKKDIPKWIARFGNRSSHPTNFILYPADRKLLLLKDHVEGLALVPVVQNFVDLMTYGGSGSRVAMKLAMKYRLFG